MAQNNAAGGLSRLMKELGLWIGWVGVHADTRLMPNWYVAFLMISSFSFLRRRSEGEGKDASGIVTGKREE